MGEVHTLKGVPEVPKDKATAEIIAWLRSQADMLENGDARPAHKAVLVVFEDGGDECRVKSAFYNARLIERVGMLQVAAADAINGDD